MEEKDKIELSILPPAPEDEKPEEGFVPYCGSEEAEAEQRNPKKKMTLFLILVIVLIVIFAGSILARQFNYYHAVLGKLRFDYREGEATYENSADTSGSLAKAISEEIGDRPVRISAAMYMFDEKQKLQNVVAEYDYLHKSDEETLDVHTGSENALFMKSFSYRKSSDGNQKRKGSEWVSDPEAYVPKLNEYFFGTEDHGGIRFAFQQSSDVEVGGKMYTCELWLMEDSSGSRTVYTTLYRYYSGSQLEGVRILFDFDNVMEVYDVRNYIIG